MSDNERAMAWIKATMLSGVDETTLHEALLAVCALVKGDVCFEKQNNLENALVSGC